MANRKKPLPRITLKNLRPPYDEANGDYVYFADAAGNPFRHEARGFELVNAWWLCEAATLAYSEPDTVRKIFTERTPLGSVRDFSTGGGTECFVAAGDDFAVVAFRGTESSPRRGGPRPDFREVFLDVLTDADIRASVFGEGAKVHRGFKQAVDEVWEGGGLREHVASLPSRTVWFTGHSLGAALATLAAARSGRLDGLYTFGSPRVGDAGFAAAFSRLLSAKGTDYYRFVNNNDVVTTVPLTALPPTVAFKHVGELKHIDASGRVHSNPAFFEQLKDRVRGLLPVDAAGRLNINFVPDGIEDHVPTLYATHIWNAYVGESDG
jgi:triacylglycerol lipase